MTTKDINGSTPMNVMLMIVKDEVRHEMEQEYDLHHMRADAYILEYRKRYEAKITEIFSDERRFM